MSSGFFPLLVMTSVDSSTDFTTPLVACVGAALAAALGASFFAAAGALCFAAVDAVCATPMSGMATMAVRAAATMYLRMRYLLVVCSWLNQRLAAGVRCYSMRCR